MFETKRYGSSLASAQGMAEIVYHNTVRTVRKTHRNAVIGLCLNILQSLTMVAGFYFLFDLLGMRSAAIRGDFILYIMSGIFLFMTHAKTLAAVSGAETSTSAMMKHAPMNTAISIASAALAALYQQVLSMVVILWAYHVTMGPITIFDPIGAFMMVLLAWFTGVGVGLCFFALRPWMPEAANILTQIYARVNMIASGKMFVANTLPPTMLAMFDWNPLFHAIDQCRGFIFINYFPRNSSIGYAVVVGVVLIVIGMMAEFVTRKQASVSWSAGR